MLPRAAYSSHISQPPPPPERAESERRTERTVREQRSARIARDPVNDINNRHPHVQKVDPHVNGLRRQRRIRPGQRASPADATDDADSPPTGLPGARA